MRMARKMSRGARPEEPSETMELSSCERFVFVFGDVLYENTPTVEMSKTVYRGE